MACVASIVTARRATALALVGLIAGCVHSERGESVFIEQNKAAAALGTMLMDAEMQNPSKADRLYDAESTLASACEPLRKAAQQKMAGKDIGFELRHLIFNSLDQCAAETKRVEKLVWETDPAVGRFYLTRISAGTTVGK